MSSLDRVGGDAGSARGGRSNSEDCLGLELKGGIRFAPQKGLRRIVKPDLVLVASRSWDRTASNTQNTSRVTISPETRHNRVGVREARKPET